MGVGSVIKVKKLNAELLEIFPFKEGELFVIKRTVLKIREKINQVNLEIFRCLSSPRLSVGVVFI